MTVSLVKETHPFISKDTPLPTLAILACSFLVVAQSLSHV